MVTAFVYSHFSSTKVLNLSLLFKLVKIILIQLVKSCRLLFNSSIPNNGYQGIILDTLIIFIFKDACRENIVNSVLKTKIGFSTNKYANIA